MTLLVRNEEDVFEENLIYHKKSGVDFFVVTDNNSTDKTSNIIEKYYKLGWIKETIFVKENNYDQVKWVDNMIRIAGEHKADWIINSDADEFWVSDKNNL